MPAQAKPFALPDALLNSFETNNRISLYLIENVDDDVWRTKPEGKGRDIASIFAHVHNVRLMWLKAAGSGDAVPEKLDGGSSTKQETAKALEESCRALEVVLRSAFETDGRVKGFKPDAAGFLAYLIAHDAHHRGQISMLARQLGHPISKSAMFGMWEWGTR